MKQIWMYIGLILLAILLSYALTAGIVWVLCLMLGVQFSLRTATVVWLVFILLKGISS